MVTLNPRLSVTHNGHNTWKLYISNVEPKDSGTYMCQINTDPMKSQVKSYACLLRQNNLKEISIIKILISFNIIYNNSSIII